MWRPERSSLSDSRTFQPQGGRGEGGGVTEKNKKKHEILAFKPLLQEIRLKNLTVRKIFWSFNI